MTRKTLSILALLCTLPALSGCGAVLFGAAAVVGADLVAEDNGRNLF